jgi:tRNA(Ile)-lysidine synthase
VNFKLRGKDSEEDHKFLVKLANDFNCPIYIQEKNAKDYANTHQLSTQVAARKIRYRWFKECLNKEAYDFLLTAHHADDNLETYLINSFRGTGIKGLKGIPEKRDSILRPILDFSRQDLLNYAKSQNILWREDISNASDNYLRNIIRHHLMPFFKKRQDNLYARFDTTLKNINRQETLLEDYLHLIFKQISEQTKETYRLKIDKLKQFPNYEYILIELLKEFGFKDWESISELLEAQVGKFVSSPTHKLVKERGFLELYLSKDGPSETKQIILNDLPKTVNFKEGHLHFKNAETFKKTDSFTAFLSKDLLKSELCLRPYKIGDYFCPLGMTGRRKLSDFLKDEKLTTLEKSKVWVLEHQNDIIWVINHRIDDRYKITENTQECLKITYSN